MTDDLSLRNRFSSVPLTGESGNYPAMPEADPKQVGRRLRAFLRDPELDIRTVDDFARLVGAERNAASAWLNGYNLPRVPVMAKLIEAYPGLTLDWIYFGDPSAVPVKLYIKLMALMEQMPVPVGEPELAEESEPTPRASRKKANGPQPPRQSQPKSTQKRQSKPAPTDV